ncbi:hypothetical protein [Microbacterium sp. SA39]|uniref:hypothetical protein n=1 Tax=Microbacterium sp. SA39 TaxID=1263625 RepID=UPI00061F1B53|nr:hypothetical protein [Microbacterium sp. SA39]KJQ52530.1 hypothetical protein RS85_03420 [Microbacterium sp. SA39]
MPTFANTQVHMTPQTLTTTLQLNEILDLLVASSPDGSTRTRGWRGITDDLERPVISDDEGSAVPELWAADPAYQVPERVAARLVWWEKRAVENLTSGSTEAWFKDGVDVLISKTSAGYLLLWSTNDPRLIKDPTRQTVGSALDALLTALRRRDSGANISSSSVLSFNREAYLWLTNAAETKKDIGHSVTVTKIASMGTNELNGRQHLTNRLNGEVNLVRTSFLSALGSGAELGPADVEFTERGPNGRIEHTTARIIVSGGAKLLAGDSKYEALLTGVFKRLRVAERLAYRYLPLVRDGHINDANWGIAERDLLILEKQVLLVKEFRRRAKQNAQYAAWVAAGGDIDSD